MLDLKINIGSINIFFLNYDFTHNGCQYDSAAVRQPLFLRLQPVKKEYKDSKKGYSTTKIGEMFCGQLPVLSLDA